MKQAPWWQGKKGEWYVIIQFILFGIIFFAPKTLSFLPDWPERFTLISYAVGLLLGVIGSALIGTGLLSLGTNLSALPHPKDTAEFVERGPYKLVRHPIYSGIIFGAIGWGFLVQGFLTLLYALILFFFFDFKTRREERFLANKFAEYDEYRGRVRKLIPYIY